MRRPAILGVLLLALGAGGDAMAAECAGTAQRDLEACAAEAYRRADATLNTLYTSISGRLKGDAATLARLAAAERAWIAYRDAECAFATGGAEGGSVQPMLILDCRRTMTQARIGDLKRYLACEEGDMACPVPPK